jgi:OmpA-OmpF porin, OOP family
MNMRLAAAALAAFVSTTAWAGPGADHSHWYLELDTSWYAGGSLGQSTVKDWSSLASLDDGSYRSVSQDDRDIGYRVFGGLGLSRYFAIELGYADLGEASFRAESDGSGSQWAAGPQAESFALEAIDLALAGKLPLRSDTALVARFGALRTDAIYTLQVMHQSGPISDQGSAQHTDWFYGAGIEYDGFRPLRLIAAYTAADFDRSTPVSNTAHLDSIALSLAYLF